MKIRSGSVTTEAFHVPTRRTDTERLIYSLWPNLPITVPAEHVGRAWASGDVAAPTWGSPSGVHAAPRLPPKGLIR